jgi:protein-arginine kinase activator protein McsA
MARDFTLHELRERLQRAVQQEEFEAAATLRDQIRGLE